MHRLSGADAGFLYLELANQPLHVQALAMLQPPRGEAPVTLEGLRAQLSSRLDRVPALRWRIKRVPFGIHHPVVFEDPDFDLDHHLSAVTLAEPGGPEQLDALYARLAGRCLDRRRPLWAMTLVDGLEDGRQALIVQIHHCLMDGIALFNALSVLFSPEGSSEGSPEGSPEGSGVAGPPAASGQPERVPGGPRLLAGALIDHLRGLGRLPGLIGRSTRGAKALKAHTAASTIQIPAPGTGSPLCSINLGSSAERRFARALLPLGDVRTVKEAAGVTVNDVALAVCAGALRSYLQERDDLPAQPLMASVPVGLAAPGGEPRTSGNQWAILGTTLATDRADPWERLEQISLVTGESKRRLDVLGRDLLRDWAEYFPPFLSETAARGEQRKLARQPERFAFNVTVSNLRGPSGRRTLAGSEVEEIYFTGPPSTRLGVVFTLSDQGDHLVFGILSVADSVEGPQELADGLQASLRELVKLAEDRPYGPPHTVRP